MLHNAHTHTQIEQMDTRYKRYLYTIIPLLYTYMMRTHTVLYNPYQTARI